MCVIIKGVIIVLQTIIDKMHKGNSPRMQN